MPAVPALLPTAYAAACVVAAAGPAICGGGGELDELIRRLRERDAALPPFAVTMEMREIPIALVRRDGSADLVRWKTIEPSLSSSWALDQTRFQSAIAERSAGNKKLPAESASWDGAIFQKLTGEFIAPAAAGRPWGAASSSGVVSAPELDPLYRSYWPLRYGWRDEFRSWPDVLSADAAVRTVGRGSLGGIDCIKIIFDAAPPVRPHDVYLNPTLLWFDDRGSLLLAGRDVLAETQRDRAADAAPPALLDAGRAYTPMYSERMIQIDRTPAPVPMGREWLRTWIDPKTSSVQRASLVSIAPTAGAPATAPTAPESAAGGAPKTIIRAESSAAADLLLEAARREGLPATTGVERPTIGVGDTPSLETLDAAAKSLGLYTAALDVDVDAADRLPGRFLALMNDARAPVRTRWVLAEANAGKIQLIAPNINVADLRAGWTGGCLAVSAHPIDAESLCRPETPPAKLILLAAGALGAAASCWLWIADARERARRSRSQV